MASEKAVYWTAVAVLALAVTNGFVSEYRGWADRLAGRSISMVEQASQIAAGYAKSGTPDSESGCLRRMVRSQVRLAHVQSNLARRRAEIARVQVEGIRTQVMERGINAVVVCPRRVVITDLPQVPQIFEDDNF
jgi:hypothetical protein